MCSTPWDWLAKNMFIFYGFGVDNIGASSPFLLSFRFVTMGSEFVSILLLFLWVGNKYICFISILHCLLIISVNSSFEIHAFLAFVNIKPMFALFYMDNMFDGNYKLVRAACVRYHRTKCPLLTVVTFLPEGVIAGFQNFAWGFKSQKNKIWGKTKILGPNLPLGRSIFL